MIIKRNWLDNDSKWCTQTELPILDCLADVTVYCITGSYFYHTKIEALGFDQSEMAELFTNDYEGRSTSDVYNFHGKYHFEKRRLGDILETERKELKETTKKETLNELKKVIALMEDNNSFKK